MYQQSYYHHRPRHSGSYFLPFLSLIILGLIIVLVFQIVDYFQEKQTAALENKAAVTVVAGKAEMKIWGVDQWTSALSGGILHEGDQLRTAPGSRVVLGFLNGSVIRLGSETAIELAQLKTRDAQDQVAINLTQGEIWLRRAEQETVRTQFSVTTAHFEISSLGTVFAVEKAVRESVHVLDGKVNVAVKVAQNDGENARVVDTVEVAFGQEVSLSADDIRNLQNKRTVPLLALLDDDFRSSDWYSWNRSQDVTGEGMLSVQDAVDRQAEVAPAAPSALVGALGSTAVEAPPKEVEQELTPPLIITPAVADRTTKNNTIIVTGETSSSTQKMEVTTYIAGRAEPYFLQKYQPGSTKWSYVVSRQYGNLFPGVNRFTIIAVGKDGRRSSPTELTIMYDQPVVTADLSAPVVVSFNGSAVPETTEDSVRVEGKIGKGIAKMYVNDFVLTQYVPDSGAWGYYAKTVYGNLKEGENMFAVYGVDGEGKATPVTEFSITKKPKPAAAAEEEANSVPAASSPEPAL